MLKYYFAFLCYLILKIDPGNCNMPCMAVFDLEERYQWSCDNEVDGKADVIYTCFNDGERNTTSLSLLLGQIPVNTRSLTIQNCKVNLRIRPTVDIRNHEEAMEFVTKTKYEHFSKLSFINITDLTMGSLLSGLQLIMNGNLTVSFENIDNMRILPSALITSDPNVLKYNNSKMESLNFTMSNVNIYEMETEAIDWIEGDVPIEFNWNNVNVKHINTGAIKMHDSGVQYPLEKNNSYPENNVYITNSTFNKLPTNAITGLTKNFVFANNRVRDTEPLSIDIISRNTTLHKNEIDILCESAFSFLSNGTNNASLTFNSNTIKTSERNSIYFGAYDLENGNDNTISIQENKFKCLNSSWLLGKDKESRPTNNRAIRYDYVSSSIESKYEQILLRNTDNVCIDDEFKNSYVSVQTFYHKYPIYGDSWEKYPEKQESPIQFTRVAIVLLDLLLSLL